jgi:L-aspartate oxidase
VIVGSGIAGLYTALNIDERFSCIVLSKENIRQCNSYLAQGGIAAVTKKEDKLELHYNDTLYAGAGICNKQAVEDLVSEGPKEIERLVAAGVKFDTDSRGDFHATREGGHSKNRILHCGGDSTGKQVEEKLFNAVAQKKNITYEENTFLADIVTQQGKAAGIVVYDGQYRLYVSPNIVICSGGIGQVYKYTTNPRAATGDGIAAALRAGAELDSMEFVQFHPTALYFGAENGRHFLISEAVRGEGGILRNQKGECFMRARHPMGDLAPRDIVAREIFREIRSSKVPYVYLDITSKTKEYLMQRFPTIYSECKRQEIDISSQFIPVCPVQHYFMGGIKTDLNGRSSIQGVYACGEAACTGVHGANRLASNSLLECLVFARRCAQHINQSGCRSISFTSIEIETQYMDRETDIDVVINKIKNTMSDHGGIIKNQKGLEEGIKTIDEILLQMQYLKLSSVKHMEALNMAMIARQILSAAAVRKESVGAHYRDDTIGYEGIKVC